MRSVSNPLLSENFSLPDVICKTVTVLMQRHVLAHDLPTSLPPLLRVLGRLRPLEKCPGA